MYKDIIPGQPLLYTGFTACIYTVITILILGLDYARPDCTKSL